MMKADKLGRRIPVSTGAAACAAVLAVAGCGSGGPSSSSKTSTTATPASAGGPPDSRRAQIENCLKKQGITLPQRPPRPRGQGPGFFGGGGDGPRGPRRFNDPKLRAALAKCGITPRPGGFGRNSPAFRAALTKFAACMRSNGYPLPAPNFSGNGPVFHTGKINQNDPKFRNAYTKCRAMLSFRRRPAPGSHNGTM